MKIVICVTLLCVAGVSSVQELSGLVNGSVEIPTAVKNGGTLSYNKNIIVDITNGKVSVVGTEFAGRIKWNSRTGVLSITDLQMEDAGEYEVQADNQRSEYQLTVYIPVSKPIAKITRNYHPCTLLCTVDRGTEVTLSWYREGDKESFVSSDSLNAPYAKLPQTVERSGTYTCEAVNSVSRDTTDKITVGEECAGGAAVNWQTGGSKIWMMILAVMVTSHSFLL